MEILSHNDFLNQYFYGINKSKKAKAMKTSPFSISAQGVGAEISQMFTVPPKESIPKEKFSYFKVKKGLVMCELNFECRSAASETIKINNRENRHLIYILNQGDPIEISYCSQRRMYLHRFQNFMFHCNQNTAIVCDFKPHRNYKLTVFITDMNYYNTYVGLDSKDLQEDQIIHYKSKPDLKITDYLFKINQLEKKFPNNIEIFGYIVLITGLLYSKYLKRDKENSLSKSSLRAWEIKELNKITEEIQNFPERNYTVNSLSKKTGISIPHLQEGFKEMHGHTVTNFIREVRLKKAEALIKETDLNISEIVYSIGLSSRSYFSRIFKKKYKCSPSDYQRQLCT